MFLSSLVEDEIINILYKQSYLVQWAGAAQSSDSETAGWVQRFYPSWDEGQSGEKSEVSILFFSTTNKSPCISMQQLNSFYLSLVFSMTTAVWSVTVS